MPHLSNPEIYVQYFALFIRNLVRFIDSDVYFERAEAVEQQPFDCLIHQEMEGRYKIFTGFDGSVQAMVKFSALFAKMAIDSMDEVAHDSLGEFMNVQNGLFLSSLSNEWVELELMPSEFQRNGKLKSVGGVVYRIPFTLSFGKFNFFIGVGSPVFNYK